MRYNVVGLLQMQIGRKTEFRYVNVVPMCKGSFAEASCLCVMLGVDKKEK